MNQWQRCFRSLSKYHNFETEKKDTVKEKKKREQTGEARADTDKLIFPSNTWNITNSEKRKARLNYTTATCNCGLVINQLTKTGKKGG